MAMRSGSRYAESTSSRHRVTHAQRSSDDDEDAERDDGAAPGDAASLRLPILLAGKAAKNRPQPGRDFDDALGWIDRKKKATVVAARKRAHPMKAKPKLQPTDPTRLSLLDEQLLILCHSAMKRQWGLTDQNASDPVVARASFSHEAIYAATQIQCLFRGYRTRCRMAAPDGRRHQLAAKGIQLALRRVMVARRVQRRLEEKLCRRATQIQAWYRGCRCRDELTYAKARVLVERITLFQRRFRGYRFWNLVAALLHQRRSRASTHIQRLYRGVAARRRVRELRFERLRFARELQRMSDIHRYQARCGGCRLSTCSEESLFTCFMTRFVGLHDIFGAKQLGQDGIHHFPLSSKFHFVYSMLLQVAGEDLEISLSFLRKSQQVLACEDADIEEIERRFLFPALQMRKNDIGVLLALAVFAQCSNRLSRAESYYQLALEQAPIEYAITGYLHRVDMVDHLLLNYHRFCSIFNTRQTNLLAKLIPIAKRGEQVRLMVAKFNHYTVIYPADESNLCRFNSLYLTDDEVFSLLSENDNTSTSNSEFASANAAYRDINAWRQNSRKGSQRKSTRIIQQQHREAGNSVALESKVKILVQAYQQEFHGLLLRTKELAIFSESRSRLRVTRENAERLMKEIIFLAPQSIVSEDEKNDKLPAVSGDLTLLHRVMIIPSVIKRRQVRMTEVVYSHAIVNAQRIFRGFRVRARIRRENLLHSIQQRQVDEVYTKLHRNFMFRERRRLASTTIQRVFKGFALRKVVASWRVAAREIQRLYRGYRGRKRAIAFREGNLTFYMAERVFQRGVCINDHHVMLIVEKCGLTFRLEAYDMKSCTTYPGFFSHASTMGLLRYCNWALGQSLCGTEILLHSQRALVKSVAFIKEDDAECVMECVIFQDQSQTPTNTHSSNLVTLTDCIQAINLRNLTSKSREAAQLLPPIREQDTARIVSAMVERLALVPALAMATKELQKKTPGRLILTVMPPPKVHYVYASPGVVSDCDATSTGNSSGTSTTLKHVSRGTPQQMSFPKVHDIRGVSIGKTHFRQKCRRHEDNFTRCRCVLPLTSTSAHVEAIALALAPPPPPKNT